MSILDKITVAMIMVDKWRAIDKTSGLCAEGDTKEIAAGRLVRLCGIQDQVNEELISLGETSEQQQVITEYVDLMSRVEKLIDAHE